MEQNKPKLTFNKSLHDKEENRLSDIVKTDVITRLKNTVDRIKRIYGYIETSKNLVQRKIYFK